MLLSSQAESFFKLADAAQQVHCQLKQPGVLQVPSHALMLFNPGSLRAFTLLNHGMLHALMRVNPGLLHALMLLNPGLLHALMLFNLACCMNECFVLCGIHLVQKAECRGR